MWVDKMQHHEIWWSNDENESHRRAVTECDVETNQ